MRFYCTYYDSTYISDVRELEKGMDLTKRELENRLSAPINTSASKEQQKLKTFQNQSLQEFADRARDLVSKMRSDVNNAQTAFKDCVEYFGEDTKASDCNAFFGYLVRFMSTWKVAEEDNLKRKRMLELQAKQAEQQDLLQNRGQTTGNEAGNMKSAVINELKTRNNHRYVKNKPEPNEFQDGTFEDIILGMKSNPYRTNINEGMRKSFRRQRGDPMAISTSETEPL